MQYSTKRTTRSKTVTTMRKNNSIISTHSPNNPQIFDLIKSSFGVLKRNGVPGLKDLNLIQSKRQAPNLKRMLTKAQFSRKAPTITKCGDPRCLCCPHLLLAGNYVFKNTGYNFVIKTSMSCDSSNVIYTVICSGCNEEYIGETGVGQTKIRDRVRVYRQHVRDKQYQQLKVEEHIRDCGKGEFKIFPFLQMRSNDTFLRRSFESKFQRQFKTKLNWL